MKLFSVSKRRLFDILRESTEMSRDKQKSNLTSRMLAQLHQDCPAELHDQGAPVVRTEVSRFCSKFYERWKKSGKTLSVFLSRYGDWLNGEIVFEIPHIEKVKKRVCVGRPSKSFEDSTTRSKRRKTEPLREKHSAVELLYAAATQFRSEGDEQVAKLLQILCNSPRTAADILDAYNRSGAYTLPVKVSPEKGVSLIIEADLSKAQYLLVRSVVKEHHADVFPSYDAVLEAKQKAYPSPDSVKVSGTSAEVRLQDLLNHNASRIVEVLDSKGLLNDLAETDLELAHKWGCDGSGGHPQHKLKLPDEFEEHSSILLTAIVPLQLKVCGDAANSQVIWTNPVPSSTRFCQPLHIQFLKETKESLKEEEKYFADQIASLLPSTVVSGNGKKLRIYHRLSMTMIDGKARNILTDTSSMATCCACGATPTAMTVSSVVNRPVNTAVFKYGISVLHARIRFLECVLHVSYRLEIKKWSANKSAYNERKTQIQNGLRKELGILVDVVKQGAGSTNDGNTARKFFENPSVVSAITGFNKELIERFSVIQTALASGKEVDANKFRVYALETAQMFEDKYPWYYMPASVHFILIHGADVMASMELPMGVYSEEALEARNKNIRSFREHRTRKFSTEATMTDLFNRLLLTGDAVFSSFKSTNPKHHKELSREVQQLLK